MVVEKELLEGIALIAQGKEEGFNILYSHTYNYVYSRAKYIMKDEQDALDLTQETYIHVYKGISTLEDANNFYAWLGSIVYRQGMRIFRKKREILVDDGAEGIFEDIVNEDRDTNPEESTDVKATADIIRKLIDGLPELQRAAVLAYYYDNMKIDDIAKAFDCSVNTIKSRLSYAKKYLRTKVEEDEKKNCYKLHSVSPAVILLAFKALFAEESYLMPQAAVQEIYNGACNFVGLVPETVSLQGAASASAPTTLGANKAASAAGKTGMAAGVKVGIAIGVVVVAAVIGAAFYANAKKEPVQEAIVQEEESVIPETEAEETETETAEAETEIKEAEAETEAAAEEEENTTFVGELDPAELTWRETTAERGLYEPDEDWENAKNGMPPDFVIGSKWVGETIDEIIQMYNDPSLEMPDVATFLNAGYGSGKCSGMTYESLKWLKENGYETLDGLVMECTDNVYVCIPHMLPDMPADIDNALQREIDERNAFFEKRGVVR